MSSRLPRGGPTAFYSSHRPYQGYNIECEGGPDQQRQQYDYRLMYDEECGQNEMIYDEFDEDLLLQTGTDRVAEALSGRARLSLPTSASLHQCAIGPTRERTPLSEFSHLIDANQYAFYQGQQCSSSPKLLISSPSVRAIHRHQASFKTPHSTAQYQQHLKESPSLVEPSYNDSYTRDRTMDHEEHRLLYTPSAYPQRMLVQGIELVPTRALPDRFRSLYSFPVFNAMQSKCFQTAFGSPDNLVLSSPTGSGKTVVLELAICRTMRDFPEGQFKIVYLAPTKALCAERNRDWSQRFVAFNLPCAELTGDSTASDLRAVQHAAIIIATPEKWDSMTRKWKDYGKLVSMIKLFLIDEVHILKEDRGAALEVVVSRMHSVSSQVRFIALSATVPNSNDIATWLSRGPSMRHLPAVEERFGEEFRPVKLQKHVAGYPSNGNDFAFDKMLDNKLPDIIAKYSHRKPIMVFCATRASTVATAKFLSDWFANSPQVERFWEAPRRKVAVLNRDLNHCVASAVAFHHGGMSIEDRQTVEQAFLCGDIGVICCTSTLAVGVNLPCHFVILKNTVTYAQNGLREYSDLVIMQMLGRAGRPQFDTTAVAVIMTRREKVQHYEKMVSGQEILESCLHLNLIDHLNAEIGMGTITDICTAKNWLMGTFLYVRMAQNPHHYKLQGDVGGSTVNERLDHICTGNIDLLREHHLITGDNELEITDFGEAMARYYVSFDTMKVLMAVPVKAKVSNLLTALADAVEFHELRFRSGEKAVYKTVNSNPSIRFPVPVSLNTPAHKVSLILQSTLGGVEFPDEKHRQQYNTEVSLIFQHVNRFIRCIIDCQLQRDDSIAIRNALMLARSLSARVWDDSPLQMKQITGVGYAAVRKFVNAGVKSIEQLECMDSHRIENIMGRRPGFGLKFLDELKAFPRLRVSLTTDGSAPIQTKEGLSVKMKAEIGFTNEQSPVTWQKKPVFVCFLAETSDGSKIHFCRISAKKLGKAQEILFSAIMKSPTQSIVCCVMCDEIAGTQRDASLKPKIDPSSFPVVEQPPEGTGVPKRTDLSRHQIKPGMNSSKKRMAHSASTVETTNKLVDNATDDFADHELNDSDLMHAVTRTSEPADIGDLTQDMHTRKPEWARGHCSTEGYHVADTDDWQPRRLANGNWECNHSCKNKTRCKHQCCKDGLESKPKPPKTRTAAADSKRCSEKSTAPAYQPSLTQSTLKLITRKRKLSDHTSSAVRQIDLCRLSANPRAIWQVKQSPQTIINSAMNQTPHCSYDSDGWSSAQSLVTDDPDVANPPSDYGTDALSFVNFDTTEPSLRLHTHGKQDVGGSDGGIYSEDDSLLGHAMVGLAESQDLKGCDATRTQTEPVNQDYPGPRTEQPLIRTSSRGRTEKSNTNEIASSYTMPLANPNDSNAKGLRSHHFDSNFTVVSDAEIEPIPHTVDSRPSELARSDHKSGEHKQVEAAPHDTAFALKWLHDMGLADCVEIV